jgi:uncharacterized protein YbjT (DUF2867 family)
MSRTLVTTGNAQFSEALVAALARHRVQTVSAPGPEVTHVLMGVRPGSDKVTAVHDVLRQVPDGVPVIFLANAFGGSDDAAIDVVKSSERPWTIVHPNALMEYSFGSMAPQILMGCAFGMSQRGRVGFVGLEDVVRVIARIVLDGGHEAQEYVCTGPEALDMPTVLATLSEVIGRHLDYIDLPEPELADLMMQHAGFDSREDLEVNVLCHLRAWRDGGADVVTTDVVDVTGVPPMSAREWFEAHRSEFSGRPSLVQKAASRVIKARYGGRVLR